MSVTPATDATFEFSADHKVLHCCGDWTISGIVKLKAQIKALQKMTKPPNTIDGSGITKMDTAGALFFQDIIEHIKTAGFEVKIAGLAKKYQTLVHLVASEADMIWQPLPKYKIPNFFYQTGEWAVEKYDQLIGFVTFAGELFIVILSALLKPRQLHWRSILSAVENTGYQALPIVALMSFLIGVVVAYQLAEQLRVYGADIFIVDVTGIAIFREFGPLITAIIVAGRTSTSFAALIGTMKVNEEIDALRTMGLSPLERLVAPRIIGLLIALPLLVVWADFFGVFGSMVMSKNMLDINFLSYLERFEYVVGLKHFVLGLIKAPFFALIIASVGCFQGFQVEMNAESVGVKTTKAAVQAIFLIIVADAGFSILYSQLGL